MRLSPLHYLPLAPFFFMMLALVFVFAVVVIELNIVQYAYQKIGIQKRYVFAILLLSLLGSSINIPIAELPGREILSNSRVQYFGMIYVIPEVEHWPGTVLAVNLGGAVIPFLLSLYLIVQNHIFVKAAGAVAVVAGAAYSMATPILGLGIAVPVLLPGAVAATVGWLMSREKAAALAYVAGSLGTLIGADLMNLGRIQALGAPVASLGGAGTYDGVFVAGIFAVLLA